MIEDDIVDGWDDYNEADDYDVAAAANLEEYDDDEIANDV